MTRLSRDAEILHAAAKLFRKRGFAAVGVDEIGRAVGLTGPAIYRHFSSKEEILNMLFDQGMDEVFRVTTPDLADPFDALAAIARAHARHVLRNPLLAGSALNAVNSWPRRLRDENQVDVLVTMVLRGAESLSAAG